MPRNVPDDWDRYWLNCEYCGARYHASEGGCDACPPEDDDEAHGFSASVVKSKYGYHKSSWFDDPADIDDDDQ